MCTLFVCKHWYLTDILLSFAGLYGSTTGSNPGVWYTLIQVSVYWHRFAMAIRMLMFKFDFVGFHGCVATCQKSFLKENEKISRIYERWQRAKNANGTEWTSWRLEKSSERILITDSRLMPPWIRSSRNGRAVKLNNEMCVNFHLFQASSHVTSPTLTPPTRSYQQETVLC